MLVTTDETAALPDVLAEVVDDVDEAVTVDVLGLTEVVVGISGSEMTFHKALVAKATPPRVL